MSDMAAVHANSKCTFSLPFKVIVSPLLCTTLVLSCVENALVCAAVARRKKLRTVANILIVSLSVSDIIIGLAVPTLELCYIIPHPHWPLGSVGTDVQNSFWLFSMAMPFVTVTVITIDRYRAVSSITRYREKVTLRSALLTVLGIWTYIAIVIVVMALNFKKAPSHSYEWNVKESWYYAFLVIHVAIPFVIICFLYYFILRAARTSRAQVCLSHDNSVSVRSEVKLSKTIGIITAVLFLVWLPVFCLEVVYAFDSESCTVSKLGSISVLITCLNGVANPWIYWRRNVDFRKAFIDMLSVFRCCLFRRKIRSNTDVSIGSSI